MFYHGFTHIIPHLHVSFLIQVPSRRGHQDLRPAAEVRLGLHGRLLLSRHAAEDDASTALCWGAKHRFFAAKICKDQMFFLGKPETQLRIGLLWKPRTRHVRLSDARSTADVSWTVQGCLFRFVGNTIITNSNGYFAIWGYSSTAV